MPCSTAASCSDLEPAGAARPASGCVSHSATEEDRAQTNPRPAAPAEAPTPHQTATPKRREPLGVTASPRSAARPHPGPTARRETPLPAPTQRTQRPGSTTTRRTRRSPRAHRDARSPAGLQGTPGSRRSRPDTPNRPPTTPTAKPCTAGPTAARPRHARTSTRTHRPPTRRASRSTGRPNGDTSARCAAALPGSRAVRKVIAQLVTANAAAGINTTGPRPRSRTPRPPRRLIAAKPYRSPPGTRHRSLQGARTASHDPRSVASARPKAAISARPSRLNRNAAEAATRRSALRLVLPNTGSHAGAVSEVQLDRAHRALLLSTFHCGGCLTLRCGLTDADVHRSAQRPERRSHLVRKEFRLFPGGEVTALLEFVEVHEVGVGALGPAARYGDYLDREAQLHRRRDRDFAAGLGFVGAASQYRRAEDAAVFVSQ